MSTVALLAAVALINLVVDPYGIFRIVDLDGFNRIKSQAGQRAEIFKRRGLERMRPNAVILGNSRAEIGFDPDSPAWPDSARPVFNLALPGTGADAALDQLTRALSIASPRLILVALDFLDFRSDAVTHDEAKSTHNEPMQWLRERASALLTLSALADSMATVIAQRRPYPASLTDSGFNPMRDYVGIARSEGYYAMFRQRDEENAKTYVRGPKTIYRLDGRPSAEFRAVDRIIAIAGERGITVRFVIYPYHAHTLILFHQTGLWPAFEDWKRELVKRVEAAPAVADVQLWDFSGFSPYADEAVPQPGDTRSDMRWYWEAGHFKKSLGDALLGRLFTSEARPIGWGRRLTGNDLEAQLVHQRLSRDEYETSHAREAGELAELVTAARTTRERRQAARELPPSGGE